MDVRFVFFAVTCCKHSTDTALIELFLLNDITVKLCYLPMSPAAALTNALRYAIGCRRMMRQHETKRVGENIN